MQFKHIKQIERLNTSLVKKKGKNLVFIHGFVIGKDNYLEHYSTSHIRNSSASHIGSDYLDHSSYHAIILEYPTPTTYKIVSKITSKSGRFMSERTPVQGCTHIPTIQEFIQKWLDPSFKLN